jgi:hypothetical protein
MPIPTSTLPHIITIEPYEGDTAEGPSYGTATTVRARVVAKRRMVRTGNGADVTASATITVRPGVTVPAESKVTHGDRTYTVLDAANGHELRGTHSWQLLCDGPRGATA